MDAELFRKLVSDVSIGKKLPDAIYIHRSAIIYLPAKLKNLVFAVGKALKIDVESWDVVKISRSKFSLSLLSYPSFFEESYPPLTKSVSIDLSKLSHKITEYKGYDNPPILHRKETMVSSDHPSYQEFCLITQEGDAAGLYENTRHIGFKASWENIIQTHGYELVDGRLFRNSALFTNNKQPTVKREKTAIVRYELSAPMKALAKVGYLDGQYSIFDYGCGRGDDLRELEAHGLDVLGWDPNFLPDAEVVNADLVNLGFVINVIEERNERAEAIQSAWEITDKLLVISAMLANEKQLERFTPYKDGVITSRNTFQKYYTQSELRMFIELNIDEQAIAAAPGIYFVFKDKVLEQEYLQNRHRRTHRWQRKSEPKVSSKEKEQLLITQNESLFTSFWKCCLLLGRCPSVHEFADSEKLTSITGSIKRAFRIAKKYFGTDDLTTSQKMRTEDLLVYFAVGLFGKRKAYVHQSDQTKRDIKELFGTNKNAQHAATELLFKIADVGSIESECVAAEKYLPASVVDYELEKPHSLTLHKRYIDLLSPLLRVYVFSALQLYGELDDIQLIKLHIRSGKLTLLGYEDFKTAKQPRLKERVKIKMAEQDVDFFDYVDGDDGARLMNKDCYIGQ